MTFDLQGEVGPERFRRALARVQERHELLQVVVDHSASPARYFKPSEPELPLTVSELTRKDQWGEIVPDWLRKPIAIEGDLLWRAVLLMGKESSEAVFHLNHTIMDGHSLAVMASDLMRAYDNPDGPLAPLPQVGSCESMLPPVSLAKNLKSVFGTVRSMLQRSEGPMLGIGTTPGTDKAAPTGTGYRIIELDRDVTSAFMKQVKASGEGPHAVVAAIMMLVARDQTCPDAESVVSNFSAAVNIRPMLEQDVSEHFGYFVTGFQSRFSVNKDDNLQTLARRVNGDIKSRYNLEMITGSVLFKRIILALKRDPHGLVAAARKSGRYPLHLTNMGRLPIQAEGGGLYLRRFMAIPSIELSGSAMILLQLESFDGRLQLLFTWLEPHTAPEFVDRYISDVEARVRAFAAGAKNA